MTDAAEPRHPGPVHRAGSEFYRTHSLDELLEGVEPLGSVDELFIEGLTDDEAAAFLAAIES